MKGRWNYK